MSTGQIVESAPRPDKVSTPTVDGSKAASGGSTQADAGETAQVRVRKPADGKTDGKSDSKSAGMTEKIRRDAAALRNALAFTQAVGVLMRSPQYNKLTLADLEWLVIPPLMTGQFRIGEAKPDDKGPSLPVAVVFWASVSPEVDKRLMDTKVAAPQLKPEDWKSGDILWLLHAAGETRFVRFVVDQLAKTTFKGRQVKVLARDSEGNAKIHVLDATQSS